MRLQTFYNAKLNNQTIDYGIEAIAADKELATHIQEVLIWLKFLDPPADGKFGPISSSRLRRKPTCHYAAKALPL
ncbi:MAG: hypothetical protein KME25_31000 [Symplocastrum torsivum CPER-KK1]|jgi:hypothetical protein|uniref:Uncharacterized protein n=1 Tax=Symplocastrum torsivum CPER-KK1 TaxID=450513 RepID=A0A951PRA3_9CYAN|nr:hypothetical protein [Symplocastrum torsivum CPER-KK1]